MSKFVIAVVAVVAMAAGCAPSDGPASPTPAATTSTDTADQTAHESGPESPIAYGLQVPRGAVQQGPLVRFRSSELIAAYQPALDAALQQEAAQEQERADEALKNGETIPTPKPTPATRPSNDTFKPITNPPSPDSTISLMRIDGKPSSVVKAMIRQIAAALPSNAIDTNSLGTYCEVENDRYVGCLLDETGLTKDDRKIHITLTIDPGDLPTRTAPAGAQTRPVMKLSVTYVGDPAEGQKENPSGDLGEVPDAAKTEVTDDIIWPKMDVDAAMPTLDGKWKVPEGADLLLSGMDPRFVALHTQNGREADDIAREFVESHSTKGPPDKNVVEDLNEISTTYRANSAKRGLEASATYVLSGRGTYVMLFYSPPDKDTK